LHPGIKSIEDFKFTDQDFTDFKNYLAGRKFSYRTITEMSLNELIANAKKEKYYDTHQEIFTELQKELNHTLDNDLNTFRNEITELLEDEILGRYFYEEGAIAWTIKTDEQVLKAVEILNKSQDYNSILEGKKGSIVITHESQNKEIKASLPENTDNEVNI
jgi:carboxyl-terminal processing protease